MSTLHSALRLRGIEVRYPRMQTTYTSYVPKEVLLPHRQQQMELLYPSQGGITAKYSSLFYHNYPPLTIWILNQRLYPSPALLSQVRGLDSLPRPGSWQRSYRYLSQVLKRNQNLKVLDLSKSKIDVQALAGSGEGLVRCLFRFSLRLFMMTRNTIRHRRRSEPMLWIHALCNTFPQNRSLKRLYLSSIAVSSQGAISRKIPL